jgi:hypothetical protein
MKFKDKFTKVMETATGKLDTNLNSALADP